MRSILRVGITAGVLGCLSMYLLARGTGLVVALGLLVLGLVSGLAMAKWLEWPWYGRQLEAGLKAGVMACVPAGLVSLVALFAQGPHDLSELAGSSHLGAISVSGLVVALGFSGWVSADLLAVVLATGFGIVLAAAAGLLGAWSKSARTVQQVTQAHEAAHALRRGTWTATSAAPVPAFPSSLVAGATWQGATSPSLPAPAQAAQWAATAQNPSAPSRPSRGPAPQSVAEAVGQSLAASGRVGVEEGLPAPGQPPANSPTNTDELRAAMREALAMWGDDTGENPAVSAEDELPEFSQSGESSGVSDLDTVVEQPTERRKRSAKASQFLNDKKKGRKKSDTRDWLC